MKILSISKTAINFEIKLAHTFVTFHYRNQRHTRTPFENTVGKSEPFLKHKRRLSLTALNQIGF